METVPKHWELIPVGASKTSAGKRIGVREVFSATRETAERAAALAPVR